MNKKIVILGGGTGTSTLVKGLKQFPVDISVVVSVCDDGASTGKLRKEFDIPAVGDLRKVLAALSDAEPLFESLLEYRFNTTSDLNGHTVGNLLLVALNDITGNMSSAIESLSNILKIKGRVLPLTEDNVTLMGIMEDESLVEGEHNITESSLKIKDVYYKENPIINPLVIKEIKDADMIILSMGSLYTSLIPNLLSDDIISAIDKSKASILYTCNAVDQVFETEDYTVGDHVEIIDKYLGKHKVDAVLAADSKLPSLVLDKYIASENKSLVKIDEDKVASLGCKLIKEDLLVIEGNYIRHNGLKLATSIFNYLMR